MKNSLAKRLISLVLLVGTAGVVLGAVYALRRNCEGFGCPNATALWSAWTAVYGLVGVCGLRLRTGLVPGSPSRKMVTASLGVLAALGLALVAYWALTRGVSG